jgi:endoglucanase
MKRLLPFVGCAALVAACSQDEPNGQLSSADAGLGTSPDAGRDISAPDAANDAASTDVAWEQSFTADGSPIAPGGYYVVGNTVFDAGGTPHIFRGVDRPSLEWQATGAELSQRDFLLMAAWRANVVRVALNQDFWLEGALQHNPFYKDTVDAVVRWAEEAGMDVILDLHWSDHGDLSFTTPGQRPMADANSITFWKEVATKYRGDGRVMFELYNEPHDIDWDTWQNGGPTTAYVTENRVTTAYDYDAVGMQALYDAVRSVGADNLVWLGGLGWAYDLSGVPDHLIKGYNIGYASHPYQSGGRAPSDWDTYIGVTAKIAPVMLTEFGNGDCSRWYYTKALAYAKDNKLSWSAWAWYVGGCGFPSVIADWNGTPNYVGWLVYDALASY